jgi:hypothetical protein
LGEAADFDEVGGGRETGVAHGLETLDLVAERAGEFAVDVERAAAHAGDGAHVLHARVGETAEDERFAGAEGVADDAGDLDREGLRRVALENRPDFAGRAGAEVGEREDRGVVGWGGGKAEGGRLKAEKNSEERAREGGAFCEQNSGVLKDKKEAGGHRCF